MPAPVHAAKRVATTAGGSSSSAPARPRVMPVTAPAAAAKEEPAIPAPKSIEEIRRVSGWCRRCGGAAATVAGWLAPTTNHSLRA